VRGVVWLLLLAVVAVVAALTFGRNDGLVSFYWGGWRADVSLNLFLLALLALGAAALLALQALLALLQLPRRAAQWRALQRERAAQGALREALAESYGARYARSHKAALRALTLHHDGAGTDVEFAQLAHLVAASGLHRLGDRARRDEQLRNLAALRRGSGQGTRADDGARLAAVEWALDDGDAERAAALLSELPPGVARRMQALRLRLRAARLARRPLQALQTARLLAKHQAFSAEVARGLLRSLASEALDDAHDAEQLRQAWQQLDAADRRDPYVAARAAERAVGLGLAAEARAWLRPHWEALARLDDDARERLALATAHAAAGVESDWLPLLDAAVREHRPQPAIQAAVGLLFAERQLWGKARPLLESAAADAALTLPLRRMAWLKLAGLAREQGDDEGAARCDRAAAALGA
jgi:HemY protein